ncbi:MAG: thiamine pyrophosphate-binding protein [Bacillota bacterium]|nr:thiamine pyrophosphate-binding protein [Bacillota bacterium]
MEPTVAEHVVRQLAKWQVPFVFGVVGDTVAPLVAALGKQERIRYVGVRQEDAAGFMASAYAKLTGEVGVCLADGGPGCVKLLNGVYDAHFDRVPVVALTGQAETTKIGTRWPQVMDQDLVFHEAAGAYNHTLTDARQAPQALYQALRAAFEQHDVARLGLPKNIQQQKVASVLYPRPTYGNWAGARAAGGRAGAADARAGAAGDGAAGVAPAAAAGDVAVGATAGGNGALRTHGVATGGATAAPAAAVDEAARRLAEARRPLILAGRGAARAVEPLLRLAATLDAAVVHTLPALGLIPWDHPLNAGVVGEFGTPAAARLFGQADVVLVVGSTWWQPEYAPDATYIQLDTALPHVGMAFPVDIGLLGDAAATLNALIERLGGAEPGARGGRKGAARTQTHAHVDATRGERGDWRAEIEEARAQWHAELRRRTTADGADALHPGEVAAELGEHLEDGAILCLDVGDNTFWVSSGLKARRLTALVSGHWRSMGFALPAANAARLVERKRQVVAVTGDGGLGEVLAEFTTAVQHELPVLCIVFRNGSYAEEKHAQMRLGLDAHGAAFHNPDFAAFAEACGGAGIRVERPAQLRDRLAQGFRSAFKDGRPTIVDVPVAEVMPDYPMARGGLQKAKEVPELAHL